MPSSRERKAFLGKLLNVETNMENNVASKVGNNVEHGDPLYFNTSFSPWSTEPRHGRMQWSSGTKVHSHVPPFQLVFRGHARSDCSTTSG